MGLPGTSLGAFRAYFFGCFGPQFFKLLVGNNTSQSLPITGLFGAKTFITVGTYILFFSEMWGRKPTLWISVPLMAACFIIVMVVKEPSPAPDGKVTPAGIGMEAMIFLTNSIYQFTWGPLPWPYTSEIFPTQIREFKTSVAVSTQWLFNFLFSLVTRYMMNSRRSYVFLFYAVLDIIMTIKVCFFCQRDKRAKVLKRWKRHSTARLHLMSRRSDAKRSMWTKRMYITSP